MWMGWRISLGVKKIGSGCGRFLTALEAKERLVELLNAYIDARQESVRVVFDLEEQAPEMAGLVPDCGAGADGRGEPGDRGGDWTEADALREYDECGELYRAGF